jgi:hypothetical protein
MFQVMRRFTSKNLHFGTESFGVTVSPGGDHAFVLALIVIMDSVYLHSHHHGNNQQLSKAKVTKNLFPMGGGTTFFLTKGRYWSILLACLCENHESLGSFELSCIRIMFM